MEFMQRPGMHAPESGALLLLLQALQCVRERVLISFLSPVAPRTRLWTSILHGLDFHLVDRLVRTGLAREKLEVAQRNRAHLPCNNASSRSLPDLRSFLDFYF